MLFQLGAGIGAISVGLIALGTLGSVLKHLHLPIAAAAAPSSPPATSQPGPAALSVSWSCPTPGKGWTATVGWPADEAPYGTTGGTTEWIRAGNFISIDESSRAIVEGQVTAPAGC